MWSVFARLRTTPYEELSLVRIGEVGHAPAGLSSFIIPSYVRIRESDSAMTQNWMKLVRFFEPSHVVRGKFDLD